MSRKGARVRVQDACIELDRAERQLDARWLTWRQRIVEHRATLLIGGGLLGGFALATFSPPHWSRVGAGLFGGGAWLMRSPLGPALLGALFTKTRGAPANSAAHPTSQAQS